MPQEIKCSFENSPLERKKSLLREIDELLLKKTKLEIELTTHIDNIIQFSMNDVTAFTEADCANSVEYTAKIINPLKKKVQELSSEIIKSINKNSITIKSAKNLETALEEKRKLVEEIKKEEELLKKLPEATILRKKVEEEITEIDELISKYKVELQEWETKFSLLVDLRKKAQEEFENVYSSTNEVYKKNIERQKAGEPLIEKSTYDAHRRDLLGAFISYLEYPSNISMDTLLRRYDKYLKLDSNIASQKNTIIDELLQDLMEIQPNIAVELNKIRELNSIKDSSASNKLF